MSLTRDPAKVRAWQDRSRRNNPLSPVGARKRRTLEAEAEFRRVVSARVWCEANTPACPPGRHEGHHAHHIQMRSQGGSHDPETNGLLCCWRGHSYLHSNPAEAYENGWLVRRGGDHA